MRQRTSRQLAALSFAFCTACSIGCGSPQAPAAPTPAAAPLPCSLDRLLSFDPGLEVVERRPLPTARQRAATQTEHLVVVACDAGESDDACRARAEREVSAAYPTTVELSTEIVAEQLEWHARLSVDRVERQQVFAFTDELAAELQALRDQGSVVVVLEALARPTAESPRNALVRALGAASGSSAESLRVELLLLLPNDEVRALSELQRRASRKTVLIHSWERQDERTLRLEISCVRPVTVTPSK